MLLKKVMDEKITQLRFSRYVIARKHAHKSYKCENYFFTCNITMNDVAHKNVITTLVHFVVNDMEW